MELRTSGRRICSHSFRLSRSHGKRLRTRLKSKLGVCDGNGRLVYRLRQRIARRTRSGASRLRARHLNSKSINVRNWSISSYPNRKTQSLHFTNSARIITLKTINSYTYDHNSGSRQRFWSFPRATNLSFVRWYHSGQLFPVTLKPLEINTKSPPPHPPNSQNWPKPNTQKRQNTKYPQTKPLACTHHGVLECVLTKATPQNSTTQDHEFQLLLLHHKQAYVHNTFITKTYTVPDRWRPSRYYCLFLPKLVKEVAHLALSSPLNRTVTSLRFSKHVLFFVSFQRITPFRVRQNVLKTNGAEMTI